LTVKQEAGMKWNPYIFFGGNCREAFEFYQKALGGKIVAMSTHGETPAADHVSPDWRDKIIHARLVAGDNVLMGSDAPPDRYARAQGFNVNVSVDDSGEADRVFRALAEGGTVVMPLGETFWAVRFGMLTDKFGIGWMVNCEKSR
jgi:PhnB protein